MERTRIDALLDVRLLPSGHGKRKASTSSHEWKCRLKLGQQFFDAMLVNQDKVRFEPGADARADVIFLRPDLLPKTFSGPLNVELWELSKVGAGKLVLKDEPAAVVS